MNETTRRYICQHANDDVHQLALRPGCVDGVDLPLALDQIAGRQTARRKLPSLAAVEGIVYPPHLSMEQCSSEATARYKASLVAEGGQLLVDLTAGFGIDALFLAEKFERVVCVERNQPLCTILSDNAQLLGRQQVEVVCDEAEHYLPSISRADIIYLDPARRDSHGARTYGIADCTPDVLKLMETLRSKTPRLLLKLSPMLDWRKAVDDLRQAGGDVHVATVHIVAVDNECKELLIDIRDEQTPLTVVCVNLLADGNSQRFEFTAESKSDVLPTAENKTETLPNTTADADAPRFLYEPNASLMKAGCFGEIERCYPARQLDQNSHLFVSEEWIPEFPGRCFSIACITSMNKQELRQALNGITRANISVRNFPMTAEQLRRRLHLQDGGDHYIFATTVAHEGRRLLVCRKKS